jgi:CRP/FNR family transcriptional regulator
MTCGNNACPFHELDAMAGAHNGTDLACRVTNTVKEVRFDAGAVLFSQGEPSTSLYSLSRGIVKITCHTTGGREQIVGIANPGNLLLGLQSLETDSYQYTAVAETDVVACKIRHRGLLKEAEDNSDIALRLLKALNAQLAQSRELMRVMGHKCAAAKIASFITMLIPEGERIRQHFTLPFSRAEIASLLGLSEETVCRQMAKMKRSGILYSPRGRIEILDWDRLQAVADEACIETA